MRLSAIWQDEDRQLQERVRRLAVLVVEQDLDLLTESELVLLEEHLPAKTLAEADWKSAGQAVKKLAKSPVDVLKRKIEAVAASSAPWSELVKQAGVPKLIQMIKKGGSKVIELLSKAGAHGRGSGGYGDYGGYGGGGGRAGRGGGGGRAGGGYGRSPGERIEEIAAALFTELRRTERSTRLRQIDYLEWALDKLRAMP